MNPFAGLITQILADPQPVRIEHPLAAQAYENTAAVLAFVRSAGRPVTWMDVADRFGMSRRASQRRLQALRDQLHVNRSGNRKGMPASYEWRGA
jgi:hypothetical protein